MVIKQTYIQCNILFSNLIIYDKKVTNKSSRQYILILLTGNLPFPESTYYLIK